MRHCRVLIIGAGPAGYTAALYLARARMEPLLIEGPEPGGQLTTTTDVENFPGFPKGIQGPELVENMRKQAARFGAQLEQGVVERITMKQQPFHVQTDQGELTADAIILATGASAKLLGVPGEKEYMGQGVSTCATCDGFFFRDKRLIVVGGGDSAMEEALFLTKFATDVRIVHRREQFRASQIMQERARKHEKISFETPYQIEKIAQLPDRRLGLHMVHAMDQQKKVIEADGIFIAIGHHPNTSFLHGQLETDAAGYLRVQPGTTRTHVPGLFACGDVQDAIYRQAITAAGSGCMAAMDCERHLSGSAHQDWGKAEG